MFRFQFWAPIEYYDPNARFPDCKWKPGRFIGIARDHGDPLTYRVWTTTDDGGWRKGRELIRNVVRHKKDSPMDGEGACTKNEIEEFVLVPNRDRSIMDDIIKKHKKKRRRVDQDSENPIERFVLGGAEAQEGQSTKHVTFADEIATPFSDKDELDLEVQVIMMKTKTYMQMILTA